MIETNVDTLAGAAAASASHHHMDGLKLQCVDTLATVAIASHHRDGWTGATGHTRHDVCGHLPKGSSDALARYPR